MGQCLIITYFRPSGRTTEVLINSNSGISVKLMPLSLMPKVLKKKIRIPALRSWRKRFCPVCLYRFGSQILRRFCPPGRSHFPVSAKHMYWQYFSLQNSLQNGRNILLLNVKGYSAILHISLSEQDFSIMTKLLLIFAAALLLAYISEQNTKAILASGHRYNLWNDWAYLLLVTILVLFSGLRTRFNDSLLSSKRQKIFV